MGRKSSKDAILDATERVIRRQGMAGTTLEAVAAEAGLSKRALFYHFKNKKDMLLQLLERYGAQFTGLRQEIYDSLPDGPHRLLKATVLAAVRHPVKKKFQRRQRPHPPGRHRAPGQGSRNAETHL